MTNEMYSGLEAEGRLKGVHTLFSQQPCLAAVEAARERGISHVFFGVRGHELSDSDFAELDRLIPGAIPPEWTITIQVRIDRAHTIPAWALSRCHVLLYMPLHMADLLSKDVEVKLENSAWAAVYGNPQMIDLTYVRDKEIK
jgi:hypothetical protein